MLLDDFLRYSDTLLLKTIFESSLDEEAPHLYIATSKNNNHS